MLRSDDGTFWGGRYRPGPLGRTIREDAGRFSYMRLEGQGPGNGFWDTQVTVLFAAVAPSGHAYDREQIDERIAVLREMAFTHLELDLEDRIKDKGGILVIR